MDRTHADDIAALRYTRRPRPSAGRLRRWLYRIQPVSAPRRARRIAARQCPRCGSPQTMPIIAGLVRDPRRLEARYPQGFVWGCLLPPGWLCRRCGLRYQAPFEPPPNRQEPETRTEIGGGMDPRDATPPPERDQLTGLLRWPSLRPALQAALSAQGPTGLLMLDLDELKCVNDEPGMAAGDMLLAEVARRIAGAVPSSDLVARFGGDEFVIVMPGVSGLDAVRDLARRLQAVISQPWTWEDRTLVISASAGVHVAADGETENDAVRATDMALYRAKMEYRFGPHSWTALEATKALRGGSQGQLQVGFQGLIEHVAPGSDVHERALMTSLMPFLDCARRIGQDPAAVLAPIAATAGPRFREAYAALARRSDVTLATFGWSLVELAAGRAYRLNWPGTVSQ
jgi:diguanylate cyclase (GGDEF)-like protein